MPPFVFVSPPLWNNMTLSLVIEVVLVMFQSISGFAVSMVIWCDSYSHCTFQVWPLFFLTPGCHCDNSDLSHLLGIWKSYPYWDPDITVLSLCHVHIMSWNSFRFSYIATLIVQSADHFVDDNIFMKPRVTTFLVATIISCGVNTSLGLDEHCLSSLSCIPKQTSPYLSVP